MTWRTSWGRQVAPVERAAIRMMGGHEVTVDRSDYEWLSSFKWCLQSGRYAFNRSVGLMHRAILEADSSCQVDHINGNGLDNRRANLRLCKRKENNRNRTKGLERAGRTCSSRYKGVCWKRAKSTWVAQISVDGVSRHLGYYACEVDAARAYDKAAAEHYGEFARLNFPNEVCCE